MTRILIIVFLFLNVTSLFSQYITTKEYTKDTLPNGKVIRETETITKVNKDFDVLEHYSKITISSKVYYPSGIIKSIVVSINKDGNWGKPCNEIFYHIKNYNDKGTLLYDETRKCDTHKFTLKKYNDAGNLILTKKVWSAAGKKEK